MTAPIGSSSPLLEMMREGVASRAQGADDPASRILSPFGGAAAGAVGGPAGGDKPATFAETLSKAMHLVESQARAADAAEETFASGGPIEVHRAVLAAQEARLSLLLAAEVRNRLLDAYQEIMRSSV